MRNEKTGEDTESSVLDFMISSLKIHVEISRTETLGIHDQCSINRRIAKSSFPRGSCLQVPLYSNSILPNFSSPSAVLPPVRASGENIRHGLTKEKKTMICDSWGRSEQGMRWGRKRGTRDWEARSR